MTKRLLHIPTATYWFCGLGPTDTIELVRKMFGYCTSISLESDTTFLFRHITTDIPISEDFHEFEIVEVEDD